MNTLKIMEISSKNNLNSYMRNFKVAQLNWELNRQEERSAKPDNSIITLVDKTSIGKKVA